MSKEIVNKSSQEMDIESFQKYGYEIIDWISEYFRNIESYPVLSKVKPGEIKSKFPFAGPKTGKEMEVILNEFKEKILPGITHWNHPNYHAYFAITASFPGILGELLTASLNQQGMLWKTSPSCTEIEEVTLSWLRQWLGLNEDFFGIIYDYASVSTMHAIAAARESLNLNIREDGMTQKNLKSLTLYCSKETHSSVEKAAIVLGIGRKNVRKIEVDDEFKINVNALDKAISEDIKAGHLPFCVIGSIGTTSSTSIDPIPEIVKICKKHNLWLHVDGAYGGSAAIVPEMKYILDGCNDADSIVLNPHKWLFTPLDCSILYCKKPEILKRTFSLVPEYLKTSNEEEVKNLMDYGIQLGRRFRSLKLWMIMNYFGHEGLSNIIREHLRLAKVFAEWVDNDPNFERLAPVPLGLVCFRFHPENIHREDVLDKLNENLMENLNTSGQIYLSHTRLNERFTLRFAIGNIRTSEESIKKSWNLIKEFSENLNF